jgi:formylglycine-generating enzyme required for sulfatase activity
MKSRSWLTLAVAAMAVLTADVVGADVFGSDSNQFTLDFVPISGATNPTSGYGIVNHDYRIGKFEITNDQWNKFTASLGVPVTGSQGGYERSFYDWGTGTTNVPTNDVSWYETAQFVNWLNTNTGNQPAYKFTGTQGTGDYTFVPWSSTDAGYNAANPYRNSAAKYFLPSEDEWVKAAYWNGTELQTYATKAGETLTQGDGVSKTGWNYFGCVSGPWNVGSGSQELNGTYDMMGNLYECMESPVSSGDYGADSLRCWRGGSWYYSSNDLSSLARVGMDPTYESLLSGGFRVASVPEPGSFMMLLGFAATVLLCYWRKHV